MNASRIDTIREELKTELKASRYEHTIGVMYTAGALAMRYGEDLETAMLAGLLHDCAKEVSPGLQHASVGAQMAGTKYGVSDAYITNAIACHTTGRPNMTLLDKILYVADYIEPNRKEAPNLTEMRHMAFQDLDECLYQILEATLNYLKSSKTVIDPMTEQTYQYYTNERRHSNGTI